MRRRSTLRKLSLAGLSLTAVLITIWAASHWWMFGRVGLGGIGNGAICVLRQISPTGPWEVVPTSDHTTILGPSGAGSMFIAVPLWIPILILGTASVVGWHRSRKPPQEFCSKCSYNLTGNVSGVCPECGKKIQRS